MTLFSSFQFTQARASLVKKDTQAMLEICMVETSLFKEQCKHLGHVFTRRKQPRICGWRCQPWKHIVSKLKFKSRLENLQTFRELAMSNALQCAAMSNVLDGRMWPKSRGRFVGSFRADLLSASTNCSFPHLRTGSSLRELPALPFLSLQD